ncbi:MAG: YihY/virulence factor BrkB family protein [Terriglobales bacterium]
MAEKKISEHTRQSPWKLGGLGYKKLGTRVYEEFLDDNVLDSAAALAYYFFFALFPLIFFLMAILGMVGGQSLGNNLINQMTRLMPASASQLVSKTVQTTLQNSGGGKLSFGVALALYSASAGMSAMIAALNNVFEVRETRSWLKTKALALGLTLFNGFLVVTGLVMLLFGGKIAAGALGGASWLVTLSKVAQYPVAMVFLLLSYSVMYYFAPNIDHPHWEWVTPGSAVGVFLWLFAAFALREYLHLTNAFTSTYGALGAVMILLLWYYVTGLAILIGGEVNSEIEKAAGQKEQARQAGRPPRSEKPAA